MDNEIKYEYRVRKFGQDEAARMELNEKYDLSLGDERESEVQHFLYLQEAARMELNEKYDLSLGDERENKVQHFLYLQEAA